MQWQSKLSDDLGPYKVTLRKGTLTDDTRRNDDGSARHVDFKLYCPDSGDADEKLPLIIWSHGFGGSRDGAGFLARYIASHGYFILHITHKGTDSSLWEGKDGHPWEILKKANVTRTTTLNRFYDIGFILNDFPRWVREETDFDPRMDWTKIGMSGHSFGALTTQVVCGQLTPDSDHKLINLHEPRITAAIAYSPVPGVSHLSKGDEMQGDAPDIYGSIQTPLLHMTGTDDASPINGMPYDERLQIYDKTHRAPKALLVKDQGDHMVYNGTRGALAANPLRKRHEDMIKHISLAWWDTWLKGDDGARHWMSSDFVHDYLLEDGQWRHEGL